MQVEQAKSHNIMLASALTIASAQLVTLLLICSVKAGGCVVTIAALKALQNFCLVSVLWTMLPHGRLDKNIHFVIWVTFNIFT